MRKLHGFPMSPNTRRAMLGLEESGLEYELSPVDLMSGAHKHADYLALNPTGRVPVLVDGDFVLWESNAILEYVAAQSNKGLGPRDARERGEISRWMFMNAAHLSPAFAHVFAHTIRLPEEQRIPQLVTNGKAEIDRCLGPLDKHLAGREFILDRLTIADLSVAPTLGAASMIGIDLSKFANLSAWQGRIRERASWKKIYG
ncbi:MAG: glutathione S-transferase family protein [Polyangiales bacterium]